MTPDRAALYADLRENAFGFRRHTARPPAIGAEVELLAVDAETRAPVPVCDPARPCTLPLLRAFGARHGWREEASAYGAPRFVVPDGGVVSFEPGGQIELSAPPCRSGTALLRSLRDTVLPLRGELLDRGVELLSLGVDPVNPLESVPLQLPGARYVRLTDFLESIGTGGIRMMRQTAAIQISLDWGPRPLESWRFLNAAAPYLTAVFANSPVYRGADTGERSFRARIWRELDGGRTGLFPCGADPVEEYLEFALAAPAILPPFPEGDYRPFAAWSAAGRATLDDWRLHLTTLFPEVRPKGFVEVRSPDAVAPEWYAAPLVLLAGSTYHAPSFREARALVGAPDPEL
ncbi:MAG TPA: glutamate-cysteine ligase family protein, partial [Longimicrobiaceae bacterium]|nr:glutamate-cysteine ligase family protein [Longimicrobiaceae bacterium]